MSGPLRLPTRNEVLSYLNRFSDENHSLHTVFRDVEAALLIHSDQPESDEFKLSAALLKVFFDYVESQRG